MLKLRIGLDIDGVVADSFPVFLRELNKHYGKDVKELDNYDMTEIYGVEWDEMSQFFHDNMEYLFTTPKPMTGAVEGIKHILESGHEIIYVTARAPGSEEIMTCKWFDDNNIYRDKTCFTGGLSKTFAVKENEIDIFVDDFMTNALEIASLGIPVLLMDSPYNQGKLPQGVTRCYCWDEILCQIDEFSRSKDILHRTYYSHKV